MRNRDVTFVPSSTDAHKAHQQGLQPCDKSRQTIRDPQKEMYP
jgi:hypothetical protein